MPDTTTPIHPSLAAQLPANAYHHLMNTLRVSLPPPLNDTPEDLAIRDDAAIACIAALCPANAAEANIAAAHVTAYEQYRECLRLAQLPETSPEWAAKCRAQANSSMRQAQGALSLLHRTQAARKKREADSESRERAAWTEHCARNLMKEALASQRPIAKATTEPAPEPLQPQPVWLEPQSRPNAHLSRCAGSDCEPDREPAPDSIRGLPPVSNPEVGPRSEPHQGPTTGAPEPQEEPQPAPLATPEPDARTRVLRALDDWGYEDTTTQLASLRRIMKALDGPPESDLVQSLTEALLPPAAETASQLAEPAPS